MSSNYNQEKRRIAFDGNFTPEIRKILQAKRIELGLPFQRIAAFFGVNWSTFRKWEQGPTKACELCFRPHLDAFLNDQYDEVLQAMSRPKAIIQNFADDIPPEVTHCLERVTNTYRLCKARPDLREKIIRSIDQTTAGIIANLFQTPDNNSPEQDDKNQDEGEPPEKPKK